MGRRIPRDLRPLVEEIERRELLSAITDIMAANSLADSHAAQSDASRAFSSQSVAVSKNQGTPPDTTNLALTPTGTLTRREKKREHFAAQYVGTYTVGAGRTSTEASQTFITAAGTANTMLHSDIQILLIKPNAQNASAGIGGVASMFDRNLNSNTALGLDLTAPVSSVDHDGRPNYFSSALPDSSVTLDPNISAGVYVEGYAVGTVSIHYIPSAKHTPGVLSQGKAIVTIHAQIYTANTSFILRNANIDP
jgi:hypothetical protein